MIITIVTQKPFIQNYHRNHTSHPLVTANRPFFVISIYWNNHVRNVLYLFHSFIFFLSCYKSNKSLMLTNITLQIKLLFFIPQSHWRHLSSFVRMFPTCHKYRVLFVSIPLSRQMKN